MENQFFGEFNPGIVDNDADGTSVNPFKCEGLVTVVGECGFKVVATIVVDDSKCCFVAIDVGIHNNPFACISYCAKISGVASKDFLIGTYDVVEKFISMYT